MHEAEPLLYWRVKRNGKWKFERARFVRSPASARHYVIEHPKVNENE